MTRPSPSLTAARAVTASDPKNLRYVAEFNANPHLAALMTVDEYVASRRIDDGLDRLKLATQETLAELKGERKPLNPLIGTGQPGQVGSEP